MNARRAAPRETSSVPCRTSRTDAAKTRAYAQAVIGQTLALETIPGIGRPPARHSTMRAGNDEGSMMRYAEQPRYISLADDLYEAVKRCQNVRIRGAILAVASLHDGMALTDAARIWYVDLVTLREVIRRLDEGGINGLEDIVAAPSPDLVSASLQSSRVKRRT